MPLISQDSIERAFAVVRPRVPETPAYCWPLLSRRAGLEVVVKHENHTPTGSFKARGGLTYVDSLLKKGKRPAGLVTATRGNHGQSIAIAAGLAGLPAVIVVPEGNSVEKNAAMEAFGGSLVVSGKDFDESRKEAARIEQVRGYHFIPSFHRDLVAGVATYAVELFRQQPDLDRVYVPIGMGSGICSLIAARDLLGLRTEIVGVVAEAAPAFALSLEAGRPVATQSAHTFADGIACRAPLPEPVEIIRKGAAGIVRVGEEEIAEALRLLYRATHNVAEGAGAAPLAALLKSKPVRANRVALVLTGGNIDQPLLAEVLSGRTPRMAAR